MSTYGILLASDADASSSIPKPREPCPPPLPRKKLCSQADDPLVPAMEGSDNEFPVGTDEFVSSSEMGTVLSDEDGYEEWELDA